ncbi:MAG: hypothetical protein AAF414_23895 [Pseudomonadota bacterium]
MRATRLAFLALFALVLSACVPGGGSVPIEPQPRAPVLIPELINASISEVKQGEERFLEIEALGRVPTGGWTNPRLVPVQYVVAPPNGIWDVSFVAEPPSFDAFVTQGIVDIRPEPLRLPLTSDLRGVRVIGGDGAIERRRRIP